MTSKREAVRTSRPCRDRSRWGGSRRICGQQETTRPDEELNSVRPHSGMRARIVPPARQFVRLASFRSRFVRFPSMADEFNLKDCPCIAASTWPLEATLSRPAQWPPTVGIFRSLSVRWTLVSTPPLPSNEARTASHPNTKPRSSIRLSRVMALAANAGSSSSSIPWNRSFA